MNNKINIHKVISESGIIDILSKIYAEKTKIEIQVAKEKINDMLYDEINDIGEKLVLQKEYNENDFNKLKNKGLDDFFNEDINIIKDK
jgi:5-methylthioribose kinase